MDNPPYLDRLKETLAGAIEEIVCPDEIMTIIVKAGSVKEVAAFLRDDDNALFDHFMDLTAVDYIGREPRFEVVVHLVSIPKLQRVRLKVRLSGESPSMPSLTSVYPAANWFERECYDLYGVKFEGHPNLTRIMLYEGFDGHPLRKDYPIGKRQPRLELRKPEVRRSDLAHEPKK